MRIKKIFLLVIITCVCISVIGLTPSKIDSIENMYSLQVNYPSVFPLTDDDEVWIENKINQMSIRNKCAQLIMPAVYRKDFDPFSSGFSKISSLVQNEKIGGLILFQGGLDEEINFINQMQKLTDIPLLIASDFERGLGTRIDNTLEFPHAMALGSTHNITYAFEVGRAIALESREIGVHQNFAPVADINSNPMNPIINLRSFSEDKEEVTEFVKAFVEGSKVTRFITTAKHFPGHGNTEIDSHYDLPKINGSSEYLTANELYPFIEAIKSGVQSIMVGHLEVPSFEPVKGIPASLSKSIITYLLKEEIKFEGLIVTDAMIMEAITKYYSTEDAAVMAIEAGNDIILMPPDEIKAIDALENAVNNGRISLERLDESVRKILAAKRWLKIEDQKIVDLPSVSKLISENPYSPLSKKIAEESITLLKNDDNLLPLKLNKYKNVFCITLTDSYWSRRAEYFQTIFEHRVGEITNHVLTSKDKRKEYNQILNELDNADLIIIPSFIDVKTYQGPVNLSVEQIDFIAGVLRKNISTILISFRNPYLIYLFPEAKTYLNSFSHSYPSQDAMLRSLLGEIDIKGKLPITIPDTKLSYGSGIELHKSFQSVLKYEFLSENKTKSVDEKINDAISENILPGAVVLFAKRGKIIYQKAFGKNSFGNISFFIEKDEIVNLGRLTNLFTIAVAIQLIDEGVIRLDDKLSDYFENIFSATKSKIETKNLIVQNSGYGSEINSKFYTWEKEELIQNILRQDLDYEPGEKYLYSNLNLVILQHLLEKQAGMNLDEMINKKLIGQLGITSTGFNYENLNKVRISEYNNSNYNLPLVKTNDDVMLEILNGIAGFDGLYSNAFDLAVLSQMLLQKGYYNDMQILKAPSVENWFKGFKENEEIDSTKKKIEIIDLRGCAVSINFENESFMIILSNADIRNPSNTKFADFSENLLKIFNEEISKGIL